MPPMDADLLRRYLEFYQDLGIKTLYRASPGPGPRRRRSRPHLSQPRLCPPLSIFRRSLHQGDTLLQILEDIGDCRRCRLHEGRNKLVFGVGNEQSPLVFVGEGPGADEDAQGIPFVGRAGQLLTQMIENTAKKEGIALLREDVYICNVVKCRPPDNRTPEPDEMEICGQFLYSPALRHPPQSHLRAGRHRGPRPHRAQGRRHQDARQVVQWRDIPVMVTYHPSYLLRPYNQDAKREAWEDLKKVLHFVYD